MSALSPEAYAEVLREIQVRAESYNGQVGADVDWLLAQYHRFAFRIQLLEKMIRSVTPEEMGGYPDLFFPKGGWEQFQVDVDILIPPIQRIP